MRPYLKKQERLVGLGRGMRALAKHTILKIFYIRKVAKKAYTCVIPAALRKGRWHEVILVTPRTQGQHELHKMMFQNKINKP